jgi:hypothetical protein
MQCRLGEAVLGLRFRTHFGYAIQDVANLVMSPGPTLDLMALGIPALAPGGMIFPHSLSQLWLRDQWLLASYLPSQQCLSVSKEVLETEGLCQAVSHLLG